MTANVLLDANVLVPVALTDLLLRIAEKGLIDPHWSPIILGEVARAIALRRPNQPPEKVQRRLDAMNRAFPYASVDIAASDIEAVVLPDPDDRHVVAAAKVCQAELVVTHNTQDFPAEALATHGLKAVTPDELLMTLFARKPAAVLAAIEEAAAATRNPELTTSDVVKALARVQVPRFAGAVAPMWLGDR